MSALLIFTVGHADVQLLEGGQRRELDKRRCGALHEELAQRRQDWTIGDGAVPKAERAGQDEGKEPPGLPAGAFQVCTPKLDAVLALLQAERVELSHALILHTARGARSGDPAQAGPIVQQRLADRTGVQATLVAYLSGNERLEARDDPRDAILRREVVARVDTAIAEAAAVAVTTSSVTRVVVAATGGFPEVSALVREVVRLRAGEHAITDLDVPDASKQAEDGVDRARERQAPMDPSAVVAAKRHALELVKRGNFIAAWGAVAHLHGDEVCRPWTRVIRWLYEWASSLPLDESEEPCTLPFPGPDRRAANVAMRVELALRCGDIPRAVQGTVSFFEAAVWDHLYARHVQQLVEPEREGRAQFYVRPEPREPKLFVVVSAADEQERELYNINNHGDGSREILQKYLRAHHPENVVALLALEPKIPPAQRLRNTVAHGEPTSARIEQARREMVKPLALWSPDGHFLSQPLIHDVLKELCVSEPRRLCDRLIDAVSAKLRALAHPGGAP